MEERLHRAMRDDCPRILSVLAARFGDLDVADEAVQDALVDAARTVSAQTRSNCGAAAVSCRLAPGAAPVGCPAATRSPVK